MTTQSNNEKDVVLITGASGLIGTRLSRTLCDDYRLIGMDQDSPDDEALPLDHIGVDLTEPDSVREALINVREKYGARLASVVHLAAYYDFSGEPSPLYEDLTVDGTRRLLRTLHDLNFTVDQFVFSSSMLVMKPGEVGEPLTESSELQAEWAYPESKLDAEQVIRRECGDIPFVITRIAGVYDEECHSLPVSQQIARIYERQLESYLFPGNATHGQALIHLDDLTNCYHKIIERRNELNPKSVFLIAEPDVMSYGELQDRIGEELYGREWPTVRIPKAVAKAGAYVKDRIANDDAKPFIKPWMVALADAHYEVSIEHVREQLGWNPQHRVRETLPAMIEFLKRDPENFYKTNKLPLPGELQTAT